MSKKRIAAAVVVMVIAEWMAELLISKFNLVVPLSVLASGFVGACAGGFIARRGFLIPAFIEWCVLWTAQFYILYGKSAPSGFTLLEVLNVNAVIVIFSGIGVFAGVITGQRLSDRLNVAAAT